MLGVIGLLYGVWYSEIDAAINVRVPPHVADANAEREQVRRALQSRARPLFWSTAVLVVLLLPPVVTIAAQSAGTARQLRWSALLHYDPVQAFLVAVAGLAIFICIALGRAIHDLKKLAKRLAVP